MPALKKRSPSTADNCMVGISYAPIHIIQQALDFNAEYIRDFAYIHHDRFTEKELEDHPDKKPHTHIMLKLYSKRSLKAVARWFWFMNDEGALENTLLQSASDLQGYYIYCTHINEPWKYQYSDDDFVCSLLCDFNTFEGSINDTLRDALFDILNGTPTRVMVKRYGRNYILNQRNLHEVAGRIAAEESSRSIYDFERKK